MAVHYTGRNFLWTSPCHAEVLWAACLSQRNDFENSFLILSWMSFICWHYFWKRSRPQYSHPPLEPAIKATTCHCSLRIFHVLLCFVLALHGIRWRRKQLFGSRMAWRSFWKRLHVKHKNDVQIWSVHKRRQKINGDLVQSHGYRYMDIEMQ